jgi:hypothetical protein
MFLVEDGNMYRMSSQVVALSALAFVSGCGANIPDMAPLGYSSLQQTFTEIDLVNRIKCEIHLGVQDALEVWAKGGPAGGNGVEWLKKWQAKISLKLTVDDTTTLKPGLSVTDPMHNVISHFAVGGNVTSPQSFSLGLGLQASAKSTRVETLAFTFHIADLLAYDPLPSDAKTCDGHGRVPIVGSLKIDEFIVRKAGMAASPDTVPNDGIISPFTVFSDQVTFVVTFGGNVTPVWKLVHLTANTSSPFLEAVRTRTHDVTITMAPINSTEVAAVYQAALTGQAVAAALQINR